MEILYISPAPFRPVLHGNISTVNQYVNRLKLLGHKVHFVYVQIQGLPLNFVDEMYNLTDSFDYIPVPPPPVGKRLKKYHKNKKGYNIFDSEYMEGMGELIRSYCKKYNIDAVICTYIWYSKVLEYVPDNILKIIDTHDKFSDRHLMLKKSKIKGETYSCTEEDESKYLQRADIIWARRDEERDFFNKITKSNKAITVTHFEPADFFNKKYEKLKRIGILGSENIVNYQSICDFLNHFNQKMKTNPIDIEIIIAGNVKNLILSHQDLHRKIINKLYKLIGLKKKIKPRYPKLFNKKYIKIVGVVDNINDFYTDIDVSIIPITCGTGINVKMVESMAKGVPVISTHFGIKGMESNSPFHHCQNIDELIDKIYQIYNDSSLLQDLSEKSKECYNEFFNNATKNFDETFNRRKYANLV